MLVANSPLSLATLRMLHSRAHCPRPSMCIMYGCGTACGTTLFARYCLVTPRQKPPEVGFGAPGGGVGDGAPPGAVRAWIGLSGRFLTLAICPWHAPHRYTWLRPKAASLGVSDLGAISSPLREVEIAPRSPTPRDASAGRSHVYQRAERAKGISLAPGIVPKGQSRRARRPAAHRHQTPQSRLWEAFGEVSRGSIGRTEWSHRPFHTHT